MAFFPRIQSPCPYKSQLAFVMDGDMCRMCKRQVFDLSDWSDDERRTFLAGCSTEVCVSYRLPMAAAAAVAALSLPSAAAAQSGVAAVQEPAIQYEEPAIYITVGGIKDPGRAEFVEIADQSSTPELPVTYDDEVDQGESAATSRERPANPISD